MAAMSEGLVELGAIHTFNSQKYYLADSVMEAFWVPLSEADEVKYNNMYDLLKIIEVYTRTGNPFDEEHTAFVKKFSSGVGERREANTVIMKPPTD